MDVLEQDNDRLKTELKAEKAKMEEVNIIAAASLNFGLFWNRILVILEYIRKNTAWLFIEVDFLNLTCVLIDFHKVDNFNVDLKGRLTFVTHSLFSLIKFFFYYTNNIYL